MSRIVIAFLAIASLAAGCTSTEPVEAEPSKLDSSASANNANAKCELCGDEYPRASLTMHDGKLACESCIAAHGH